MHGPHPDKTGLPEQSWLLAVALGTLACLLLTFWIAQIDRREATLGGAHLPTTWGAALREAEAAFRERQMTKARDALAEAYRLAALDPGWEALLALGDLMQRLDWDRRTGYYGRLSVTPRGACLQAFHHANARGDWEGMFVAADRLETFGDRTLAARLQALAWQKAKRHPEAMIRVAALRMPEEEWP